MRAKEEEVFKRSFIVPFALGAVFGGMLVARSTHALPKMQERIVAMMRECMRACMGRERVGVATTTEATDGEQKITAPLRSAVASSGDNVTAMTTRAD